MIRSAAWIGMLLFALKLASAVARAQDGGATPESALERAVREGRAAEVESQLRGSTKPEDVHAIARAYANQARRTRDAAQRPRLYADAEERYTRWITLLSAGKTPADIIRLSAARVELAGLLLSGQAAAELDEYEITAGHKGDRELLLKLLTKAREQYEQALAAVAPIAAEQSAQEEELLAAGVYDTLTQTRLDGQLNLGWTCYYLGALEKQDETRRAELLGLAERHFQELIDGGQVGAMRNQCYLGMAMAQRERQKLAEAEKSFGYAVDDEVSPVFAAQARYELARCQIRAGKFDEARATLRPLVEKDPDNLSEADRPARFFINLAHIWDANSHLAEAEATRAEAADSTARTAIMQKVQRERETGLTKFKRMARRGGPWPALAQLYVASTVNTRTPLHELLPIELLYTAGVLMDAKRYEEAKLRLGEAAGRAAVEPELAGEIQFELARCQYLLKQEREAAESFARLAVEMRNHPKAEQAATYAYGLWGQVAERSRKPEDYVQLANTLRNLLESFAEHPKREEAAWLLPVALQLAGDYAAAAEEFGKVPDYSSHWEEAQYRRALCQRQSLQAARGVARPADFDARARQAAAALRRYADAARERSATAADREKILTWSADALVASAELQVSSGVSDYQPALDAVREFEQQYPDSELLGRVLAVRIRAYRGLREFEQAARILQQFLQAAPPEQVGPTLAALAQGMQQEVERLLADGDAEAARTLADDSLGTFDELERWARADPQRARSLEFVLAGRARMLYLAGQHAAAAKLVTELLEQHPRNGNFQHLQALILTGQLLPDAPVAELERAQQAWAALLTDPGIQKQAPERYWEARYQWLALALRLGRAADVETAITQERVWRPDLGGAPWSERLAALLRDARSAQGKPADAPEANPTTQSQPAGTGP